VDVSSGLHTPQGGVYGPSPGGLTLFKGEFSTDTGCLDKPLLSAYATLLRLSVCHSIVVSNVCIVAKRCVLEPKLLLIVYRKSYMRNRLIPNE